MMEIKNGSRRNVLCGASSEQVTFLYLDDGIFKMTICKFSIGALAEEEEDKTFWVQQTGSFQHPATYKTYYTLTDSHIFTNVSVEHDSKLCTDLFYLFFL